MSDPIPTSPVSSGPQVVISYSTPLAFETTAAFRDGMLLVIPKGAALPAQCVKCAAPATTTYRRKFAWHSQYVYLALFGCVLQGLGVLLYLILAMALRQTITVEVPLCDCHARRRRRRSVVAVAGMCLSLAAIISGVGYTYYSGRSASETLVITVVAAIVCLFISMVMKSDATSIRPRRISKTHGYFSGASAGFLASLPDVQPPGV